MYTQTHTHLYLCVAIIFVVGIGKRRLYQIYQMLNIERKRKTKEEQAEKNVGNAYAENIEIPMVNIEK